MRKRFRRSDDLTEEEKLVLRAADAYEYATELDEKARSYAFLHRKRSTRKHVALLKAAVDAYLVAADAWEEAGRSGEAERSRRLAYNTDYKIFIRTHTPFSFDSHIISNAEAVRALRSAGIRRAKYLVPPYPPVDVRLGTALRATLQRRWQKGDLIWVARIHPVAGGRT